MPALEEVSKAFRSMKSADDFNQWHKKFSIDQKLTTEEKETFFENLKNLKVKILGNMKHGSAATAELQRFDKVEGDKTAHDSIREEAYLPAPIFPTYLSRCFLAATMECKSLEDFEALMGDWKIKDKRSNLYFGAKALFLSSSSILDDHLKADANLPNILHDQFGLPKSHIPECMDILICAERATGALGKLGLMYNLFDTQDRIKRSLVKKGYTEDAALQGAATIYRDLEKWQSWTKEKLPLKNVIVAFRDMNSARDFNEWRKTYPLVLQDSRDLATLDEELAILKMRILGQLDDGADVLGELRKFAAIDVTSSPLRSNDPVQMAYTIYRSPSWSTSRYQEPDSARQNLLGARFTAAFNACKSPADLDAVMKKWNIRDRDLRSKLTGAFLFKTHGAKRLLRSVFR